MTVQTQEQEMCRVDGDTVTVLLPSTTLMLTLGEANSLFCNLEVDLLHGQFNEMYGKALSESIIVADVPVSRDEAWGLYRSLETNVFPDNESVVGEADCIEVEASMHERVNWLAHGF